MSRCSNNHCLWHNTSVLCCSIHSPLACKWKTVLPPWLLTGSRNQAKKKNSWPTGSWKLSQPKAWLRLTLCFLGREKLTNITECFWLLAFNLFQNSKFLCLACASHTLGAKPAMVHAFVFPTLRGLTDKAKRERDTRAKGAYQTDFNLLLSKLLGRELNESYWLGLKL